MPVDIAVQLKELLIRKGLSICVAESVTAGRLQSTIASASGSSAYFQGGLTAYNIDQKVNLLGVDRDHAAEVNCVSARVAQEMAIGVRTLFGAAIAIATTGYAEPSDDGVTIPFAYYAISTSEGLTSDRIEHAGLSRMTMQQQVAEDVLQRTIDLIQRT